MGVLDTQSAGVLRAVFDGLISYIILSFRFFCVTFMAAGSDVTKNLHLHQFFVCLLAVAVALASCFRRPHFFLHPSLTCGWLACTLQTQARTEVLGVAPECSAAYRRKRRKAKRKKRVVGESGRQAATRENDTAAAKDNGNEEEASEDESDDSDEESSSYDIEAEALARLEAYSTKFAYLHGFIALREIWQHRVILRRGISRLTQREQSRSFAAWVEMSVDRANFLQRTRQRYQSIRESSPCIGFRLMD